MPKRVVEKKSVPPVKIVRDGDPGCEGMIAGLERMKSMIKQRRKEQQERPPPSTQESAPTPSPTSEESARPTNTKRFQKWRAPKRNIDTSDTSSPVRNSTSDWRSEKCPLPRRDNRPRVEENDTKPVPSKILPCRSSHQKAPVLPRPPTGITKYSTSSRSIRLSPTATQAVLNVVPGTAVRRIAIRFVPRDYHKDKYSPSFPVTLRIGNISTRITLNDTGFGYAGRYSWPSGVEVGPERIRVISRPVPIAMMQAMLYSR